MIILFAILINIIARISVRFCDFHVVYIFPYIVNTYARFFGLFPFSVGELMLYLAVLLVIILFLGGFACIFVIRSKNRGLLRCYKRYYRFFIWITAVFSLIMTTNCFVLFNSSPIYEFYDIGSSGKEYGLCELSQIRDFVVEEANMLALELKRGEDGYLVYEGDMINTAIMEMQRLGQDYCRLSGFYPRPKPFLLSNFFSQQYMKGYFFPFSMEANYNNSMYIVNLPATICHELTHVKGFIYEDEANFLAYLACAGSEDDFFRYSAYLSVLGYLERDFLALIGYDLTTYQEHPQISDIVRADNIFLTSEAWARVERTAIFSTEFVREVSSEIVETNLTMLGVSDGSLSYGRVVNLLLMYYDGILY